MVDEPVCLVGLCLIVLVRRGRRAAFDRWNWLTHAWLCEQVRKYGGLQPTNVMSELAACGFAGLAAVGEYETIMASAGHELLFSPGSAIRARWHYGCDWGLAHSA